MMTKEILSEEKYKEYCKKYNDLVVLTTYEKVNEKIKSPGNYNKAWFVLEEIKKYELNRHQLSEISKAKVWLDKAKRTLLKNHLTEQKFDKNIFDTDGLN